MSNPEISDLYALRHSAAHVMASAILNLYPNAKLGIGPATEDGFYYDIDLDVSLGVDDLAAIEKEMKHIIEASEPFLVESISLNDAIALFENQPYKLDLIQGITDQALTVYRNGSFVDLCRGPHVSNSSQIAAFKLLKTAGAYWRGDEKNKMLQRIYGTAFPVQKELDDYLNFLEEAKKRDHRKLGRELDLFSFQEEGPGFVFWHPRGMAVYNKIIDFWKKVHIKHGYDEIKTPIILHESLWHQSGHWDNYRENMYFVEIDKQTYSVKPMNCPGGILVYKNSAHSYKELPIKLAELGLVHRHERSGVLQGLFRVRQFTQDDAHVYCRPEQIEDEIVGIISLVEELYKTFGFNTYDVELSTRPAKSIGSDSMWTNAESSLENALNRSGLPYKINQGDGAFYGPKIDFHIKDSLGRSWQCGTIQLDFSMPERFELNYIGEDGNKHRPVMIHRAILGSIERFLGILIEHYAGVFPSWLSPVPVSVIPIAERHFDFANQIADELRLSNISVKIDSRNEKMGYRIRDAELLKIPYVLVIGDKEVEAQVVSVRSKKSGNMGSMPLDTLKEKLVKEIMDRIN